MALTGGNWRVMGMGGGHLKQRGFFPLSIAQVEVIALKELCLFPIQNKDFVAVLDAFTLLLQFQTKCHFFKAKY